MDVLGVTDESEPGWTCGIRFGPVVSGQDTAYHILVDLDTECQRDLLGNARAAPTGVPPFHCDDGFDELLVRSLGAGSTPTRTRKQNPVRRQNPVSRRINA